VRNGGLLDIIVVERLAERRRICNFVIALLEALILGVKAKPVFPRLGLNDVGSNTAQFFVLRHNVGYFSRVSSLEKDSQSNAIFDRLVGPVPVRNLIRLASEAESRNVSIL
jgi:hypothetical protein